jgi:UDP-glucose 4-epimerase
MKILVTGGVGFVGTNLIKRLLDDGHEVVSLDNYSTGKEENEQEGCKYHRCELFDDIARHGAWGLEKFQLAKPDVIFHLAALARIQPSFDTPVESFKANALATQNILEYARLNDVPIIYAGSSSKHGNIYSNPYTFTKWQGEELCKLYYEIYNLNVTICRFYNVYGPYQLTEGPYCTVIGIFQKLYENNKPLTITGDGEQRRDFTHVDDIVDGLVRCIDIDGYNEYEFGRGRNYSINEIADAFGEDYPKEYIDKLPGEMRETLCTDTKAFDDLRWSPIEDVINYIRDTHGKN